MASQVDGIRSQYPDRRRIVLGASPWVAAAVAQIAVYVAVRNRLPDEVVSHVGFSGPDGFMAPIKLVAITVAVYLAEATLFGYLLIRRRQTTGQYRLVAACAWGAALGEGYFLTASFAANAGLSNPRDLDFPMSVHGPIAIVICLAGAAVGVALAWKADHR
ncbi:hypothetical protein OG909_10000 [Streptomyces sp. NBC_01754]|uniref:hypothetical protein n=1 Tax=Streptomyces sp. NBC_01754 TaxID=2975930 RepID=UPI002DD7E25F|nr:hypothetical protein [Streptomyces sp. NBC_01754]WSC92601.1 hypothetical protein OG909_10000 [Streptomyces sp. NBC_01754]